jgi:hypothetical protein
MSDDFSLLANRPARTSIADRERAAEFIDGRGCVRADRFGVLSDVRSREDPPATG